MSPKAAPQPPAPPKPLAPGRTVGILGGGQLGRMLALEARRMGYKTVVMDPSEGGPAAQVCDRHIQAEVGDVEAAKRLAQACDLATLEWELIPLPVLKAVSAQVPLLPGPSVLAKINDRLIQKEFLKEHGFPQADFTAVDGPGDLEAAVERIGYPCLLKRRSHGYDGKGQWRITSPSDLPKAKELLAAPCVLERLLTFKMELSGLLARGQDGKTAAFPTAENVHRKGVLHTSRVPASASPGALEQVRSLTAAVAEKLGHVGVLAVEMFLMRDGRLLVNEIAPRVHNSGHYTLGACQTSQFEQHLRAVCGLALGKTDLLVPAVMVNLLGDLWEKGEPRWEAVLSRPELKLHLYGKAQARPGRKMGHLLMLGPDTGRHLAQADALLERLRGS